MWFTGIEVEQETSAFLKDSSDTAFLSSRLKLFQR